MSEELFTGETALGASAFFVGERIDARSLEHGEVLGHFPLTVRAGRHGCAMLYRYGAVVLFQLEPLEEATFLRTLSSLVTGAFENPATEEADIVIDPREEERVEANAAIRLKTPSLERLQVVADILAKSAVLSHYEERIAAVFDRIEPLAEMLQRGTPGTFRGSELLRQIGGVLLVKTRTVGRFEVTEKPEITWDRPDLDRLYVRLETEYELRERDRALGRKLELISTTATTLLDALQNRRSLRLELYIVILIFVEILLILADIFLLRG